MEFFAIFWPFFILLASSKFSEAVPPLGLRHPKPLNEVTIYEYAYNSNVDAVPGPTQMISHPLYGEALFIGMLNNEEDIDIFAIQRETDEHPSVMFRSETIEFDYMYDKIIQFVGYFENGRSAAITCDFTTIASAQEFFRLARPRSPYWPVSLVIQSVKIFVENGVTFEITNSENQPHFFHQQFVNKRTADNAKFHIGTFSFTLPDYRVSHVINDSAVLKADANENYFILKFLDGASADIFVDYINLLNKPRRILTRIPSDLKNVIEIE